MNKKVLKKYTIIPQELYVERSADKQLKDIIEEMQRPGYVLVARQMGKTNLLFNAQKNLTTESRKFVYIDLSNKFDTERECYNYIIDSILDVHDDELWEIRGDIDHLRDRTKVDHLSYTKSLLLILSALNTELVIILDEIDALRSTKYSDNIFAVIRSNYFARSNFPKFEQLTYILSGVIEPKDLIRDKNKSPFNIGEKIYLDDFTYEEFLTFIRKSKLCISSEVINSIYEWTSGNPRLTFDICSELESMIIEGGKINRNSIEEIVNKKYFSNFDVAPIDHIRELVSDDSEVQSAVYKIVENKDNEEGLKLSDGTKNRLYLHGICAYSLNENKIKIKNKIIERSLSLEWLSSLQGNIEANINKAIKLIDIKEQYEDGIRLLLEIVKSSSANKSSEPMIMYYLGQAEFKIGAYSDAENHLLTSIVKESISPVMHYNQYLLTGLTQHQLGKTIEGNEKFKYIIDNYKMSIIWATAALNLASNISDKVYANDLLGQLISMDDTLNGDENTRKVISHIKSISYYNLSAYESDLNVDRKIQLLDKSLAFNIDTHYPFLSVNKAILKDNVNEKEINTIIDHILDKKIIIKKSINSDGVIDYNETLNYSFIIFAFNFCKDRYKKLINYTLEQTNTNEGDLFLKIANSTDEFSTSFSILFEYISSLNFDVEHSIIRKCLLDSFPVNKSSKNLIDQYFISLQMCTEFSEEDVLCISYSIHHSLENNNPALGLGLIKRIEERLTNLEGSQRYDSSTIYYWATECANQLSSMADISKYGNEALYRLSQIPNGEPLINKEEQDSISRRIKELVFNSSNARLIKPLPNKKKKYRRNDPVQVRYSNGEIVTKKYKYLKTDIDNQTCSIID
ncbi:hypothetical protein A165_15940 [Vibrio tasmaniensis ZS-17]|uniref:AAA-like domain-containing protein n=1 Tax=Vibrio tasmaniensis TaxID=212663 RepID=UPI000301876F|nr:AAA-like domain-containing protein [Vibrio tasmaniensis]OED63024.1 hypothetical protein A165_15940 [Vibrio tasmaniensis ZS-17]